MVTSTALSLDLRRAGSRSQHAALNGAGASGRTVLTGKTAGSSSLTLFGKVSS
jgi:hypothetical protein